VPSSSIASIIDAEGHRGQAWRHHGQWTTYRPDSHRMFKAIERLHVEDEPDFWGIMGSCQGAGIKPPTSHVDCFKGVAKMSMMPRKSVIAKLDGASFGGWQERFFQGCHRGKVYAYDLNKAYRWAACQGLPDLHKAYFLTRYLDEPYAVYDCELPKGSIPYWPKGRGRGYVTTEELERFKVLPLRTFGGIGFSALEVDFNPIFRQIDRAFPLCNRRISRAFWGLWNSRTGPEQVSWKDGEKIHQMKNPFYNPIWSLYITSRVKLRMAEVRPLAFHVQVDAVLTREPLPTGTEPGEWRQEGEYPEYIGAWIGPQERSRQGGNLGKEKRASGAGNVRIGV
jgi:hypothetical protein